MARLKGLRGAGDEIDRQLQRVGLAGDAERRIGGFSKGMRQRLGLAAALLGAPELLVLDEPTDGVDPLGRAEIRRILAEERARGATLFLNSHLLAETERVCDRIGILAARAGWCARAALETLCGSGTRYRAALRARRRPARARRRWASSPGEAHGVFACDAADPAALDALLAGGRGSGGAARRAAPASCRDLEDVLAEALRVAASDGRTRSDESAVARRGPRSPPRGLVAPLVPRARRRRSPWCSCSSGSRCGMDVVDGALAATRLFGKLARHRHPLGRRGAAAGLPGRGLR